MNNAAGMALKDGRVDEISLEEWDAVFASDIRSTFYCTKVALSYLQRTEAAPSSTSARWHRAQVIWARQRMPVRRPASRCSPNTPHCNTASRTSAATACSPGLIVTPENESNVPDALKQIFRNIEVTQLSEAQEDIARG